MLTHLHIVAPAFSICSVRQYDQTTLLSRQFESILLAHNPPLLDTRIDAVVADDAEETITAVLSSWWTDGLKGLKDTAGVVYTGTREMVGGVIAKGLGTAEEVKETVVAKKEAGEFEEVGLKG